MGPLIKYFAQFVIILSLGGTSLAQVRPSQVVQACKSPMIRFQDLLIPADPHVRLEELHSAGEMIIQERFHMCMTVRAEMKTVGMFCMSSD